MSIDTDSTKEPQIDTEQLDRICLDFEDAWQAGQSPDLATHLNECQGADRRYLLRELLLLEVDYLKRRGKHPAAEDYFEKFPKDKTIIAGVFDVRTQCVPVPLRAGHRIDRYTIERVLGSGSFGTVYQANDAELQRTVALKVPKLERFVESLDLDAFVEEARTTAKLDHPAIVQVLDVVRDPELGPILVMQYVEGCSLRDRILAQPLTLAESIKLLVEIAEAMDYAHRRGFVHRDLEPRNILLDANGRPHITDFGLAVHESTQSSREGESAGSLAYMSPEQVRGDSHWLDGRSDIWAMGVIMYELLTGRRPFNGRNYEEMASEIFVRDAKPLRQISAAIPVELEQICLTCLTKNIAGRYATAQDLADALRQAIRLTTEELSRVTGGISRLGTTAHWICVAVSVGLLFALVAVGIHAGTRLFEKPVAAAVQDIELAVWSSADEYRGRINRTNHEASPLRTGDKLRLSVTLTASAYLYVFWIGVDGDLIPIYPWPAGKWDRPQVEQAVTSVSLPTISNATWQVLPGPSGTETIMAFVANRPLPSNISLSQVESSLKPQIESLTTKPLWFENGVLLPEIIKTRSPDVSHSSTTSNCILSNQELLRRSIDSHCCCMAAIAFSVGPD